MRFPSSALGFFAACGGSVSQQPNQEQMGAGDAADAGACWRVDWKRAAKKGDASIGAIRFVEQVAIEPVAETRGHRDAGGHPAPHTKHSLDEVAGALYEKHGIRLRRAGSRLLPRFFSSAPVTFTAAEGGDVMPSGLEVRGSFGYGLIFAVTLAAARSRVAAASGAPARSWSRGLFGRESFAGAHKGARRDSSAIPVFGEGTSADKDV